MGEPVVDEPWHAAVAIVRALRLVPWTGRAWRLHGRRYEPADAAGSLLVTGRFHRGGDRFPAADTWPAHYLARAPEIAFAERMRHTSAANLDRYGTLRLSVLQVSLLAVLDLGDAPDLCALSYAMPHALAAAARAAGAEALLVPSCTGLPPGNPVVFVDRLRPGSRLDVVRSHDPALGRGEPPG